MKFSVVVISKNNREQLERCIFQLLSTLTPEIEIVIVEATDKPYQLGIDRRVKYICIPLEEAGYSHQRNIGVKSAKYDTILFIDDDVIVSDDWFKNMINSINDNVFAMMGTIFPYKPNIIGFCEGVLGHPGGGFRMHNFANGRIIKVDSVSTCNTFFKKEVIEKVGCFSLFQKYGGEDTELSLRINEKLGIGGLFYNSNAIAYHKPRNSIKKLIPWYIRRGKGDIDIFFNHKSHMRYILSSSILIKILPILLVGIITPWFILLGAIFWYLLQIKRYSFMRKYFYLYKFSMHKKIFTLLIFPFIKFIVDIAFDIGRIIRIIKYLWEK